MFDEWVNEYLVMGNYNGIFWEVGFVNVEHKIDNRPKGVSQC